MIVAEPTVKNALQSAGAPKTQTELEDDEDAADEGPLHGGDGSLFYRRQ